MYILHGCAAATKAAKRLLKRRYNGALRGAMRRQSSLMADFKMFFEHFEIARSIETDQPPDPGGDQAADFYF